MEQKILTVTPEKAAREVDPDWLNLSDFEKAEALTTWYRSVVPSYLSKRFDYRVAAMGVITDEGKELFSLHTGFKGEFD
jgi:hypothetical protein